MYMTEKMGITVVLLCCIFGVQSCEQDSHNPQRPEKIKVVQGAKNIQEPNTGIPNSVEEKIPDPVPIVVPEELGVPPVAPPVALLPMRIGGDFHGASRDDDDGLYREECHSDARDRSERKKNAAAITNHSRSPNYNGFLRAVWVDHGTSVNMISRGLRAFFTADSFFDPPVTVDMYLRFVGNFFHDNQDFVIMDCRPTFEQWEIAQPILATWPNTFSAIVNDLAGPNRDCASPILTPGKKQICDIAVQYQDSIQTVYDVGLAQTLELGAQMFSTTASTDALRRDYGIFPAYTGLGFTIKDSATSTGDTTSMTIERILRNSVVPEYFLKNISLAAANCRCLQVPASASLHTELIDPDDIWLRGKLDQGACRMVRHLE